MKENRLIAGEDKFAVYRGSPKSGYRAMSIWQG